MFLPHRAEPAYHTFRAERAHNEWLPSEVSRCVISEVCNANHCEPTGGLVFFYQCRLAASWLTTIVQRETGCDVAILSGRVSDLSSQWKTPSVSTDEDDKVDNRRIGWLCREMERPREFEFSYWLDLKLYADAKIFPKKSFISIKIEGNSNWNPYHLRNLRITKKN